MDTVTYNNKSYTLTGDAQPFEESWTGYISDWYDQAKDYYMASALDDAGAEVSVFWEVENPDLDPEDACDWSTPCAVLASDERP